MGCWACGAWQGADLVRWGGGSLVQDDQVVCHSNLDSGVKGALIIPNYTWQQVETRAAYICGADRGVMIFVSQLRSHF